MLNTVAMADDYFSTNYFGADTWSAISVEEKNAEHISRNTIK